MSSTGQSTTAHHANVAGVIVSGTGMLARLEASISATRARFIDKARRAFVITERSIAHEERSEWSIDEAARRMLVAELACKLNLPENTVQSHVDDSQLLVEDLPATLNALSRGEISWRHAHVMADQAGSLPASARGAFEQKVLGYALTHTATRFHRCARVQRERMHPDTSDERHEAAVDKRSVSIQPGADGMAWLTAHLPASTAHAVLDRITDAAHAASRAGDNRTIEQLRADALASALLTSAHPTPGVLDVLGLCTVLASIRPTVHVTVPA